MFRPVSRALSIFSGFFSLAMIPPVLVALYYQEGDLFPYFMSWCAVVFVALLLRLLSWGVVEDLRIREGYMVVFLVWLVLGLMAGLPFAFSPYPGWSLAAFFEGFSGLTTTGAEGLYGIDSWPHSLRFYHQELELIGGLGVVLLALSMMPILGVGGLQLYRLESVGPVKGYKLTPRLAGTAKILWRLYLGFMLSCMVLYKIFGMSWFEAMCESFSTISTGGFSIYQDNFKHYPQGMLHGVAMVFMLLGALNFSLHFRFFRNRDWLSYFQDFEFRRYLLMMVGMILLVVGVRWIYFNNVLFEDYWFLRLCFTVVSMFTTTGLHDADFAAWPAFLPVLMMLVGMLGGCAGSTSGGIKVIRFLFFWEEGVNSLRHLLHPRSVVDISFSQSDLPMQVYSSVRGFLYIYLFVYILLLLSMMTTGLDFYTCVSAVSACLSNTGAAIAGVASGYAELPSVSKVILMAAMLMGRIEIMIVMMMFLPNYWRG